ncbi:MAG: TonB-dependent receptor [Gracilimonas sp.]|nr:TonB-dependent receptor [Gracilimonas sp.]
MRYFITFIFSLVAISSVAQTGKIRGVVTDSETGEPVIGASVIIEGTTKGNATNVDGEYIILNVEPGTYNLVFSYIGYSQTTVQDVRVSIDLTTQINVELQPEVVEGEEVTVVAGRELVRKDVTASLSSVTSEQIEAIPVENFSEVVELQAGVVDGHFRGGRTGEVGYWVDGVPVTDVFDGSLSAGVENSSVKEVQVVTGAFNAEYGQAMSGIVNIVTKDGSNNFTGSVHTFLGDYASNRTDLFRGIDEINPVAVRNIEANIDGPIIKDNLFFFASARYFGNDGWFYGRDVFDFNNVGINEQGQLGLLDTLGTGDSSLVNMNPYEKLNGQFKLTWRPISGLKVSANIIGGGEEFKNYNHGAQFIPEFSRDEYTRNYSAYLKATHSLSDRTFYDVSVSNTYKKYESYLFEDPFDDRYLPNDYAGFRANNITSGFIIGGTDNGRTMRETNTLIGKFDLTSQVNNSNQIKTGVEYRYHNLVFRDENSIVNNPQEGVERVFVNSAYDVNPIELSGYIQDKVEIGNLIINAGVRFDYFDSNFKVFTDPTDPDVVFDEQRPEDESLVFEDSEPTWQFSPRLGIAFPISETGAIHFSYGHFFQIPNFNLLYQNPFFRLGGGSGLIGLLGNANLDPQKTINGELGYKQELSPSSAVEVTAFFRDIRNLAGTATDPIAVQGTSVRYGIVRNSDFGFIKGIVLTFDQGFNNGLFFTADYTFQIAKGNASDPAQAYNAAAAKTELEKRIVPLDWDQLHTVNLTANYQSRDGWGFGAIFNAGSGFPYTPDYNLRTNASPPSVNPLNSQRRPAKYNIDLNLTKSIQFSDDQRMQIYAKIDNVLDTGNERNVFSDTGTAEYSLYRNEDLKNFRGDIAFLNANYNRPDFYNEPRRIVFGIRYNF